MKRTPLILALLLIAGLKLTQLTACEPAPQTQAKPATTGSVIFIHPDGTSAGQWNATRALYVGPDNNLHWDTLPHLAVYRDHIRDSFVSTSNAGGTVHATGLKVGYQSYGADNGKPLEDEDGNNLSVMRQAIAAGIPCGVVNSGINTEPGTGCFLATVPSRKLHDEIADQLIQSGAKVIMGGGEKYFLPKGAQGRHGVGVRKDGRDLTTEAKKLGYTIVYDRKELAELPEDTEMVLGLFADNHTFNDKPEEYLREHGLPMYEPQAPTLAEMTEAALMVLRNNGEQFFLMVEEEGTDNFANKNNASGTMLAGKRADDAIGVAMNYLEENPDTFIITAADSNASGMHAMGFYKSVPDVVPANATNGAPMDGIDGTETPPFQAKPDRNGVSHPFAIGWVTFSDVGGGVIARAAGLNGDLVHGNIDNTEIAHLIRLTLFGTPLPDDASADTTAE